jgi:hypothetical protein
MYVDEYLTKGQKVRIAATGTNVYLGEGELVQVVCRPSNHSYTLRRGDQVKLPDNLSFDNIEVTNLAADSQISLVCVAGRFFPTLDGSQINVAADLKTENLKVTFSGRQPVELPSTQKIKAEMTNFPQSVDVNVLNQRTLPTIQKVHVVEQTAPNLKYVAHETMTATGTISGNTKRKELIIKAADANKSSLWLGGFENKGYELRPGEGFVLSNGAEIEVLIPTNCKLFISEVTA